MRNTEKGFTLAELLIVVAIIAVLVAIAIPVFTTQLERSRESTDAANIRAQYAEVMSDAILSGGDVNVDGSNKVTLRQKRDGWQGDAYPENLAALGLLDGTPSSGGSAWVSYEASSNTVTIHFAGGSGSGEIETGEPIGGQHNSDVATSIGNKVVELISGASNSTKVVITVNPSGDVSVSVEHGDANASDILAGLKNAGLVSADGKANFDSSDTTTANGYQVSINKNNGHNGGSIHISAIE